MTILFIGGTRFVGRYGAEAALARGHRVTLLHRGSKGSTDIAGVEEILCDRMDDLSEVAKRRWDAVVDTCGYVPRVVRHSASALEGSVGRYLFVSSISAYDVSGGGEPKVFDKAPLDTEEITGETYGPLKVECEKAAREIYGDRFLNIRPGLIAGPHDTTNRFTHWVERFASGGPVLVPDLKNAPLQLIDARDLGAFMIGGIERGLSGDFDVAGEEGTFGAMIDTLAALWPEAEPVKASADRLEQLGLKLWTDLPLAMEDDGTGSLMRMKCRLALASGLTRRPLSETAVATHEWAKDHPASEPAYGTSRERELEAIRALVQA
jgi:2'-hydroxyisoflavone reductase